LDARGNFGSGLCVLLRDETTIGPSGGDEGHGLDCAPAASSPASALLRGLQGEGCCEK
jgi:hypothetical protein